MLDLCGKPLILHTLARANEVVNVDRVIVATDDRRIFDIVRDSGAEAVMTSATHASGTDRVAEAAAGFDPDSIIVNIQADEPMISPTVIADAVEAIKRDASADIVTTCEAITEVSQVLSSDVVKVVTGSEGYALYFSRSPIPFLRDEVREFGNLEDALRETPELLSQFKKHTGLYVYRREYLTQLTSMKQSTLEKSEMLEQLRALQNGARIKVIKTTESSIGVDTQEDLDRVREMLSAQVI
jgi:3-deoxy-manno-octulosonate cytidylyltransferase (CMP-KDO synthetase)